MLLNREKYTTTILPRSFYARDTVIVAQELIGQLLIRVIGSTLLVGTITETEAYRGDDDPACHAYRGKTKRTAPLFGMVGTTYVYFIYGNHFCLNIVSRSEHQTSGGVLIRAIDPMVGIDHMQTRRGNVPYEKLTNGPGKITQALSIASTKAHIDCTQPGELFISAGTTSYRVVATPRIGISQAQDRLWRFLVKK